MALAYSVQQKMIAVLLVGVILGVGVSKLGLLPFSFTYEQTNNCPWKGSGFYYVEAHVDDLPGLMASDVVKSFQGNGLAEINTQNLSDIRAYVPGVTNDFGVKFGSLLCVRRPVYVASQVNPLG